MSNSGFSLISSIGLRSESSGRVLFMFSLSISGTTESYQLLFIKQGIVHKLHQHPLHLEQILNGVKLIQYTVTEAPENMVSDTSVQHETFITAQ